MNEVLRNAHFERLARNPPRLECFGDGIPSVFIQPSFSLGGHTWSSSIALAKHLIVNDASLVHGRSVIELGAGTGVAGVSCAVSGAKNVLLTDLKIKLLELTCNHHKQKFDIKCAPLDWNDRSHAFADKFEVCVLADVVYYENHSLFKSLIVTLGEVLVDNGTVILCYRERSSAEKAFFELILHHGFRLENHCMLDNIHQLFVYTKSL